MAVKIDELATSFDVRNEAKLKKLIREELQKMMAEERRGSGGGFDPADPAASGRPDEGG